MIENTGYLKISGKNEENVVIEFSGVCKLEKEGESWVITYAENDSSGMTNTQTCIGISNDIFSLTRVGDYSQSLIFERNKETYTQVVTPYGQFGVAILCEKYDFTEQKNLLTAHLQYFIKSQDSYVKNEIQLECKLDKGVM